MLLYSLLKSSQRFAGPLLRCRELMRMMAEGKIVPEFKQRKYDLMGSLFEDLNTLIRASNARHEADRKLAERSASKNSSDSHRLPIVMKEEAELQYAGH